MSRDLGSLKHKYLCLKLEKAPHPSAWLSVLITSMSNCVHSSILSINLLGFDFSCVSCPGHSIKKAKLNVHPWIYKIGRAPQAPHAADSHWSLSPGSEIPM